MTREFNLIDEPWIQVRSADNRTEMVSLKTCLLNCQNYLSLAGETVIQDAAVQMLLEAIVCRVLLEWRPDGQKDPVLSQEMAVDRWTEVYEAGKLPEKPFLSYLDSVHDSFYLIDEEKPFMQAVMAEAGTWYQAKKLSMSESENKQRLFQGRSGKAKDTLTFAEAARFLLTLIAFDDSSVKPCKALKDKGDGSPGVGWAAKLGLIIVQGNNLFETLMLNCTLLKDGNEAWGNDKPYWEEDKVIRQRNHIRVPDNPVRILSIPSRRVLLKGENGRIIGFNSVSGDYYEPENASALQMTMWKKIEKKGKPVTYVPQLHSSAKAMWRDFASIAGDAKDDTVRTPGVIQWLNYLKSQDVLPKSFYVTLLAPFLEFDSKKCAVVDMSDYALRLDSSLLSEKGKVWLAVINDEIAKLEKAAVYTGYYYENVAAAKGQSGDRLNEARSRGREAFFNAIDLPFTDWIASVQPEAMDGYEEESQKMIKDWQSFVINTCRRLSDECQRNLPLRAMFGRAETGDKARRVKSASEASQIYLSTIYKLYSDENDRKETK